MGLITSFKKATFFTIKMNLKKDKRGIVFPPEKMDYKTISFLMRGKRRNKVLYSLKTPKMPKEIADKCKLNISNVSAALSELSKKDLVKCITPNEKIFKFYEITKKGQNAINHFERYTGNS